MKKLFRETNMSWKLLIILSLASAVLAAAGLIIPGLKNTSFTDPGTYPDVWFVYAIFIIMNCKSAKEAAVKTFVFFLISQPLIYLLQVPFSNLGWQIFMYYPRWFAFTVATIPGALIAYQVKRQNWLSVAVLAVATSYLALASASYTRRAINNFPLHSLSAVFCLAAAVTLALILLDKKKHKIASLVIVAAVFAATFALGISF